MKNYVVVRPRESKDLAKALMMETMINWYIQNHIIEIIEKLKDADFRIENTNE